MEPWLSQSVNESERAMPNQSVFPIYYTSSNWSHEILFGLHYCLIPVNSWGFRRIRKWDSTEGYALSVRLIPHFLLSYIHPFIHSSFISYMITAIMLHCIARKRRAKSAHTKDSLVQNAKES
jgi:hypothetical protein